MPARRHHERSILETLLCPDLEGASLENRADLFCSFWAHSPREAKRILVALLEENLRVKRGLEEAKVAQEELKALADKIFAPPLISATFLRQYESPKGVKVLVKRGNTISAVGVAEEVDPNTLKKGEEVLLGNKLNIVVERSPVGMSRYGEIAAFDSKTEDGRLMLNWREEKLIVDAAACLDVDQLTAGDQVRFDRATAMAYEKVDAGEGYQFLMEEITDIGPEQVGGQSKNLRELLFALTGIVLDPESAALYGLGGRQSVLLVGAPGCGKTLMARVAAAAVRKLSGKTCRFGVVKPGEWEHPLVGVTQERIQSCFKALREAAEDGYAFLFLDEIESIGRIRGSSLTGHHSDKFLAALLAELDGFSDRTGVAVIAATNRKDLLDPALLERLSDIEVKVERPNLTGAEEIFQIHLPSTRPYSPNSSRSDDTRQSMIQTAVSMLYSPNGENDISVIRFRDGKTRTVFARDLVSGRLIEQICRSVSKRAFRRRSEGGEPGLGEPDMREAVSDAIERLRTTLTPVNAHAYLHDLPQDVDVVSVEPIARKVSRNHRYFTETDSMEL